MIPFSSMKASWPVGSQENGWVQSVLVSSTHGIGSHGHWSSITVSKEVMVRVSGGPMVVLMVIDPVLVTELAPAETIEVQV